MKLIERIKLPNNIERFIVQNPYGVLSLEELKELYSNIGEILDDISQEEWQKEEARDREARKLGRSRYDYELINNEWVYIKK